MLTASHKIRKARLYMIGEDAQQASIILARMAILHPQESDQQLLPDSPAAPYFAVYQELEARYNKIASLLPVAPEFDSPANDLIPLQQLQDLDRRLKQLWRQLSKLEEQLRQQQEKLNVIRQQSNSLQKFAALDLDLERLRRHGKFLRITVGTLPSVNLTQLQRALSMTGFLVKSFYAEESTDHVVVFGPAEHRHEVHEVLKSADFRGLEVPAEFSGSPTQLQVDLIRQLNEAESAIVTIHHAQKKLLHDNQALLQAARQALTFARPYASLATVLQGRGSLVSLQGWIPAQRQAELEQELERQLAHPFHIEFSLPQADEFTAVPTLLGESRLLKPFRALVGNFGTPGYREIDPSGLFAFSYIAMFGMMFGDIGHGAVIALCGLFLYRLFPGAAIVVMLAGLSSTAFGFVYGSLFGYEDVIPALWISPMHDPVRVLLVAVVWGAIYLLTANALAIRNYLATGDRDRALFSGKGLAGFVFYLAAGLAAWQLFAHARFGWLQVLLLTVPFAIILQFNWRHSSGSLPERILVVLIEGVEHIISTVSSTLSFLRVAAFSLNHVALAAAVFAIAGMMDSFGHGVTVVLGNLFIIGLEGAIVAIQCLRLEYYEGFSRFFEGKGKAFVPLKIDT